MKKAFLSVAAIALIGGAVYGVSRSLDATAKPSEHIVRMKFDEQSGSVYFEPRRLVVKSGDRVTWVQDDPVNEHNVIAYPNGIPRDAALFESPMLRKKGEDWSMVFEKSGTYKYHCHPHEAVGMTAMIVVDRESRTEEFRRAMPGDHMHHSAPSEMPHDNAGHGPAGHAERGSHGHGAPHGHDRM